jgi:hypothetical protein
VARVARNASTHGGARNGPEIYVEAADQRKNDDVAAFEYRPRTFRAATGGAWPCRRTRSPRSRVTSGWAETPRPEADIRKRAQQDLYVGPQ